MSTPDFEAMGEAVAEAILLAVKPLKKRVGELETRLAALESKPAGCSWKGVFHDGTIYTEGSLVTKAGGLWLCTREQTAATPGSNPECWRLVVKKGDHDDR
jgi:tetrahydromethanopterin S-methyltransferase subunit B